MYHGAMAGREAKIGQQVTILLKRETGVRIWVQE